MLCLTDKTPAELQQDQPQFYSSLASHLSTEEQTTIQNVFAQAEAQLVMAQQAQAPSQPQGIPGAASAGLNGGAS